MTCEAWKLKLDAYLDGELREGEMRAFDTHVRGCPSCAPDALTRVQMKRSMQAAGKRFTPREDFRKRMQQSMAAKPERRTFGASWVMAVALMAVLAMIGLMVLKQGQRAQTGQAYSQVADMHVATLASASPFDVVSSDRHTVKPWFQGKIPFSFNLPELQNSEYSLLGGRVTYMQQTPGAHLIYEVRKHKISVFIFPESSLHENLAAGSPLNKELDFTIESWTQDGLRYFVIGDAGSADIDGLAKLFKNSS
jgi:anti-sigma factor RsiW